jgi:hypothetical protein
MKRILATTALGLFISSAQALEVMTWMPYYGDGYSNLVTHSDKITRLGLQYWYINPDGTLRFDVQHSEIARYRDYAKSKGIKVLLTPYNCDPGQQWNWDNGKSAFWTNKAKFTKTLLRHVDSLNLDGIDLDIEGLQSVETDYVSRYHYNQFVKDLSDSLKKRSKILTIDTYAYHFNGPNDYWWEDWIYTVDMLHVMGYESIGAGASGWQNYRHRQNWAVSKGWNPSKVAMGLPTYQASWLNLTAAQHLDTLIKLKSPVALWDLPQMDNWDITTLNKLKTIKGIAPQADASTPALDSAKLHVRNWLTTPDLWFSMSDDLGTQRIPEDDAQLNQINPGQVNYKAILAPNDANGNRWTSLRMGLNTNFLGENVGKFPGLAIQYSSNHPVSLRFVQSNPHGIDVSWHHAVSLPSTGGTPKWIQIRWTDPKQPQGTIAERTWPFNHAQLRALDFAPILPTTGATWEMNIYHMNLQLDTSSGVISAQSRSVEATDLQANGFQWVGEDVNWQLVNLKGELIQQGALSQSGKVLWNPLRSGVYLLNLKTPTGQSTKRFTVN